MFVKGKGGTSQRTLSSSTRQSIRSIPISQVGRPPRSKSRTAIIRSVRSVNVPVVDQHNVEHFVVIPPDGNYGWVIVVIAFMANFLIDGVGYTFGIFLGEIGKDFKVRPTEVAIVSSYMGGFYFITGPIACALCNRYGFRKVGVLGGITSAGIFLAASFLNDFFIFSLLAGVGTGMAFCFVYTPTLLVVGFYFEKYRALATSIAVTGSSFGIIIFPVVFKNDYLLGTIDWRWKFRIICGSFAFLSLLVLGFRPIKPTKIIEQTAQELETESDVTIDSKMTGFRKIFDQYHNAAFPTVAEYSANPESHIRRNDEISTYLAVVPELSQSSEESIFKSEVEDVSLFWDQASILSSIPKPRRFEWLLRCCQRDYDEDKRFCPKITFPNFCSPFQSNCWEISCCMKCRNKVSDTHEGLNRPMYRDDIFYQGSLATIPEYSLAKSRITISTDVPNHYSRISRNISYSMSISRVISQKEIEEQHKHCVFCPESVKRVLITMIDVRLFKSVAFCLMTLSGFLTMVGFYVPFVFMVERALELGFVKPRPTHLLTILGVANMFGRICCGASSFFPIINPMILSWITLVSAGTMILISSFLDSQSFQIASVVIFGACGASFSTLRTVLLVELVGLENLTNAFGITILFYGLANFVGIPLSSYLQETYGSYKYCFMMAGITLTLSGLFLIPIDRINRYEHSTRRPNISNPVPS